jgi:hypothetical protein
MQVFFCDRCTRRVTEGELAEEEGLRIGDLVFCRFCIEEPEVREYLAQAAITEAARASKTGFHRAVQGRRGASSSGRRNGGHRAPRHGHRHARAKTPPHGRRAASRRPATPGGPDVAASRARQLRPASPIPSGSAAESVEGPGYDGRESHRIPHRLRRLESEQGSSGAWLIYGSIGLAVGLIIGVALKLLT